MDSSLHELALTFFYTVVGFLSLAAVFGAIRSAAGQTKWLTAHRGESIALNAVPLDAVTAANFFGHGMLKAPTRFVTSLTVVAFALGASVAISAYAVHVYNLRSAFLDATLAVEKIELEALTSRLGALKAFTFSRDASASDRIVVQKLINAEKKYVLAHQNDCQAKLSIARSRVWFLSSSDRLVQLGDLCGQSQKLVQQQLLMSGFRETAPPQVSAPGDAHTPLQ